MPFKNAVKACALAILLGLAACADEAVDQNSFTAPKDIFETIQPAKKLEIFVAAIEAADLADTLKSEGPYTVFAPTDAAFEKFGLATVESLMLPENQDKLAFVLSYHIVPGKYLTSDIGEAVIDIFTVEGGALTVDGTNTDKIRVNDAIILAADIEVRNGVIHAIDTVLLPN